MSFTLLFLVSLFCCFFIQGHFSSNQADSWEKNCSHFVFCQYQLPLGLGFKSYSFLKSPFNGPFKNIKNFDSRCKIHWEIHNVVQANKNLFQQKCSFNISFKTWGTGEKRSSRWMVAPLRGSSSCRVSSQKYKSKWTTVIYYSINYEMLQF